jgi:similar to spore coat protein
MKVDYDIQQFSNMINPAVADAAIALDYLLAVKNGVRNLAISITEIATPDAKAILRAQLDEALTMHETISQLMISKGWLHPYNVNEQFQLDIQSAQTTLQLASMKLYPDHTSRLGLYPEPPKQS